MKRKAALAALILICMLFVVVMVLDLRPADVLSSLKAFEFIATGERTSERQSSAVTDPSRQGRASPPPEGESYLASGPPMTAPVTPETPVSYADPYEYIAAAGSRVPEANRGARIEVSSGDFDFFAQYGSAPLLESGRFAHNPLAGQGLPAWMGPGDEFPYLGPAMDPTLLAMSGLLQPGTLVTDDGGTAQTPQQGAGPEVTTQGTPPAKVPEPPSLMLLAGGLAGLAVLWRLWKVR